MSGTSAIGGGNGAAATATAAAGHGLGRPIVTVAPSQSVGQRATGGGRSNSSDGRGSGSGSSHTLPPLKQKTGIIKSKVPPPVPPRGSPKDVRCGGSSGGARNRSSSSSGSRTAAASAGAALAPKGTPPSAGSYTHLHDTVTTETRAVVVRRVPPPTLNRHVHVWVQTSDFGVAASDDGEDNNEMRRPPTKSKSAHELTAPLKQTAARTLNASLAQRQRPAISTQCLQRELSVRRLHSTHTVPHMVQSFSNKTLADGRQQHTDGSTVTIPTTTAATATAAHARPPARCGASLDNIRQHLNEQFSQSAAPSSSAGTLDTGQYGRELALLKRDSPVSRLLLANSYGGSSSREAVRSASKIPPQRPVPPVHHRHVRPASRAPARKKRPAPQVSDLRLPGGGSATLLSAGAGEYI